MTKPPVLGLALGGGAAKGWAQLGVIEVLEEAGIRPDLIVGTSIGAVVGACYAAGKRAELSELARKVSWFDVLQLADPTFFATGLFKGERFMRELGSLLGDARFEDLDIRLGVTAVDLVSNQLLVLSEGSVIEAIRASIAIPGLFTPVQRDGAILVDGGIKSIVPVGSCREMGAAFVIAVDVTGDYENARNAAGLSNDPNAKPKMAGVARAAFAMVVKEFARNQLLRDPPDLVIRPPIDAIPAYDFTKAETLERIGAAAARQALPDIQTALAA